MKTATLILFWCLVASAWADTLKLKDGTTVRGNLVAETDTEYVLERSLAGGTIKTKSTYRKSDVAEVVRSTPEEKAAEAMKEAYEATKRYQLDPATNYARDYYERVLEGVFRKFLADHPDSPFAGELRQRLAAWEAERDKVAAGQIKRNGQWLSAAELAANAATQSLAQAQNALAMRRFDVAAPLLDQLVASQAPSNLVALAQQLRVKAYQDWLQSLQESLAKLETDLASNAAAAVTARQEFDEAQTALRAAESELRARRGGLVGSLLQAQQQRVAAAQKKVADLERERADLNLQLAATKRTLAQVQARMTELNVPPMPVAKAEPLRPPPPPPPPPPEPTLMEKLTRLSKDYWWLGLLGLLLVVWLVLRRW